jgi:hypothetical protein
MMTALAESFPTLVGVEGVRPWSPAKLDRAAGTLSSGGLHAARFVLQVWNVHTSWPAGRFNVVDAYGTWDPAHRAAFAAWAREPFLP